MDYKQVFIKIIKGAVYGALGTITGMEFAGISDHRLLLKGLAGAAISGALHGAHNTIEQVKGS